MIPHANPILTASRITFVEPVVRDHQLVWSFNGVRIPAGFTFCLRCRKLIDREAWAKGVCEYQKPSGESEHRTGETVHEEAGADVEPREGGVGNPCGLAEHRGIGLRANPHQGERVMACEYICDGCGKRASAETDTAPGWFKPAAWFQRGDSDGIQDACSRACIDAIATKTSKTAVVLPL